MSRRFVAAVAIALAIASAHLPAIYMSVETTQVPVDRLVANLEKELESNPGNVQTILNLARLHAMAFANKEETFPAAAPKADQPEVPSYSPGSSQIPRTVKPAPSPQGTATAAQHLKEATRHYEAALALAPDNLTARLGHGWVLEQAGNHKAAIAEYRKVVEQAWPSEQKIKALMPSQRMFTQEAAGYLIPLLDKERDAAEIADLRAKQSDIAGRPRAITPVVVPLTDDIDVADLVDPLARVRFDADGSLPREWTWITPNAGWLVYDATDRGTIASALQLFGNVTFWLFWSNGYEPMRALDNNGDGELSGPELQHMSIWHDRNGDGVSDRGEVKPLAFYGIVSLSHEHIIGDGRQVAAYAPRGVRFSDGRTRPTYDVVLQHSPTIWTRR